MTISEKVAYLKGLAEGLNIDPEKSKEAKLISVMMDILEDIGLTLNDVEENALDLGEEIDALSDDLAEVEDIVYDCCCSCDDDDEDEEEEDDDDDDFFEVDCPTCGDALIIDQAVLDEGVVECPNCHERFALDFSDEESGSGCGGCCGSCGGCGAIADEPEE